MKIGVFDSGVGGLSVANAIETALPEHEIIFRNDVEHMPYASRPPQQIHGFVVPVFESLIAAGCQVIVIACNTVSTTIIDELREQFDVPLIGVEPMVKLAVEMTKSDVIAICATPTTLASQRYTLLKQSYAAHVQVIEPDCANWSLLIEQDEIKDHHIAACIEPALSSSADVIVLGCTHYHWIEDEITRLCQDKATVIQPESFVIEELKQVLAPLR